MIDPSSPETRLIPLNLVYDYPVYWDRYKVLRDFVQNFYDALPWREWEQRFSSSIVDGVLTLNAADVGFSYDWLLHIGASTKRTDPAGFAGHFGEGFKIASLCALRDQGWRVQLRSRDWALEVTTTGLTVDGHRLESLAYAVQHYAVAQSDTELRLTPFDDPDLLQAVLLSFYYPDNPLLGAAIWESEHCAVYHRSMAAKPKGYPRSTNYAGNGIVFASHQALGSFPHPLVFCRHDFRHQDRERNYFFRMDVVDLIQQTVRDLPPGPSAEVLTALRQRWNHKPQKRHDFESWHRVIRKLVTNIAASSEETAAWRRAYPDLMVVSQVKKTDIVGTNRRHQALDWWRSHGGKSSRLVQEAFSQLGYPTVEEACESAGGFSEPREPDAFERSRIQLLEALACRLAPDLFAQIAPPPCRIIDNEAAIWDGMASCVRLSDEPRRFHGIPVRYGLPFVALKRSLLEEESLGNALSTYLHEIAHVFGGDRSVAFSEALTQLLAAVSNHADLIGEWRGQWEHGAASGPGSG